MGRISGPLIDRFDIRVEVPAVRYEEIMGEGSEESSATIRERVRLAREVQSNRLAGTDFHSNAQLGAKATR